MYVNSFSTDLTISAPSLNLKINVSDTTLARHNKTSIQWIPGSQIYRSNKKIIFGQK